MLTRPVLLALLVGCAKGPQLSREARLAMTQAALDAEFADLPVVGPDHVVPVTVVPLAPIAQPVTTETGESPAETPPADEATSREPDEQERTSKRAKKRRSRKERRARRRTGPDQAEVARPVGPAVEGVVQMDAPDTEAVAPLALPADEPVGPVLQGDVPSVVSPGSDTAVAAVPVGPSATAVPPAAVAPPAAAPSDPAVVGSGAVAPPPSYSPAPSAGSAASAAGWPAVVAALPAASGGDGRLASAVESLARAVDDQRWQSLLEARLADKQRLIDRLDADLRALRDDRQERAMLGRLDTVERRGSVHPGAAEQWVELRARLAEQEVQIEQLRREAGAPDPQILARLESQQALLERLVERTDASTAQLQRVEEDLQQIQRLQGELDALRERLEETSPAVAALEAKVAAQAEAIERVRSEQSAELQRLGERLGEASQDGGVDMAAVVALIEANRAAMEAALDSRLRGVAPQPVAPPVQPVVPPVQPATPARPVVPPVEPERTDTDVAEAPRAEPVELPPAPSVEERLQALRAELESADEHEDTEDLRAHIADLEADRAEMERLRAELAEVMGQVVVLRKQLAGAEGGERTRIEREVQAGTARVEALRAAIGAVERRMAEKEARYAQRYASVLAQLQPLVERGLDVRAVGGKLRVRLPADALFGTGAATLSRTGRGDIQDIARMLAPFPRLVVVVEGHTDGGPVRSFTYGSNAELAQARADAVRQSLVEAGLDPSRVRAISFGDTRPVASDRTRAGRKQNRRIELVLGLENASSN